MDTFEPRLFLFKVFILLLVLGLPPLAIWFGKIAGGLKGWKWVGFPAILCISVIYIFGTAGMASATLAEAYKWGDSPASLIGNALWILGAACFLYGFLVPDTPAQNHPNG